MQETLKLLSLLRDPQVLIGLPILVLLLARFRRSGQLRRVFDFPPPVPNNLTGAHLVLVLAAFFGVMSLVSLTFQAMGMAPPAAANVPATQVAPAESRPSPGGQPAPAETEPAACQGPFETPTTQSAATTAPAAASQPGANPRQEALALAAQAGGEIVLLAIMLNLARTTFAGGLVGFGLRTDRLGRDLFWAIAGYLAFWPICAAIAAVATEMLSVLAPGWKPPEHTVLVFLQEPGQSVLWSVLPLILAGLIAPLFEEIFFRGLLLSWLRKTSGSTWLAIGFTGAAFGIIHAPQWHLVPALTSLGLLLGYLYARTGSLTLVILFHIVFNLRTLVLVTVFGESSP